MRRDPLANRDAHVSDLSSATENSRPRPGLWRMAPCSNSQLAAQVEQRLLQALAIVSQSPTAAGQRQNRIERQLSGDVYQRPAAAIQPAHGDFPRGELFRFAADISPASFAADGDQWRMFADQKRG